MEVGKLEMKVFSGVAGKENEGGSPKANVYENILRTLATLHGKFLKLKNNINYSF